MKLSKQLDVCFLNITQQPHERDFEKLFYQHIYINVINTLMYALLVDTTFHEDLQQKSNHLKKEIKKFIQNILTFSVCMIINVNTTIFIYS